MAVTKARSNAVAKAAKGDLSVGSGTNASSILAVGTDAQILVADSTASTGLKWATASGGSPFASDIVVNSITVGKGASSGTSNTVVSEGGGVAITTGTGNTLLGRNAGAAITTAYSCVAVGNLALNSSISGEDNTAVGQGALRYTTAASNTAIGTGAGTNHTTGTNNTFIGNGAAGSSNTASNVITLGNSSIATLRCQVTSITALSDERDKKNIEPLEVGLDFVNTLKPVTFDWNMRPVIDADGNQTSGGKIDIPDAGFIAQDFIAAEDAVGLADHLQLSYRDNPDALEITQGRLIPILVKAIQDLSAKVAALEAGK